MYSLMNVPLMLFIWNNRLRKTKYYAVYEEVIDLCLTQLFALNNDNAIHVQRYSGVMSELISKLYFKH